MEIRQLEAFLQVVSRRSFGKAAKALFVTQPALSARIKALEAEVGQELLARLRGGVALTEAGDIFLPFAERALNLLQEGRQTVENSRSASFGRLRIGSAPAISTYVLPRILKEFNARHPKVELAVTTGHSHQVQQMVLSDEVQLGLARALQHPEVEAVPFYTEELVPVTHPEHPFASAAVSIGEMGREPLILYDKTSSHYQLINSAFREAGVVPNVVMHLDSIEASKKMVLQGLGISFLPRSSVGQELNAGALVQVRLKEELRVELQTAVLHRRGKPKGGVVKAFLDVLHAMYGVHPGAPLGEGRG